MTTNNFRWPDIINPYIPIYLWQTYDNNNIKIAGRDIITPHHPYIFMIDKKKKKKKNWPWYY